MQNVNCYLKIESASFFILKKKGEGVNRKSRKSFPIHFHQIYLYNQTIGNKITLFNLIMILYAVKYSVSLGIESKKLCLLHSKAF